MMSIIENVSETIALQDKNKLLNRAKVANVLVQERSCIIPELRTIMKIFQYTLHDNKK